MAREIPLTQGRVAIVDDEDYEMLVGMGKWQYNKGGYAVKNIWNKETKKAQLLYMHRVILGVNDPKIQVDHIDRNPLNNTRSNLRVCTHQQNLLNKRSYKNSTSKFKGVSIHRQAGKWKAQIYKDGKQLYLGLYESEVEAAKAYNDAASSLFGEFAHLNQIEGEC